MDQNSIAGRHAIAALIITGILVLAGCSGGGGESEPASSQSVAPQDRGVPQPQPTAQPDMLTATPQGMMRGKANGQDQRLIFPMLGFHRLAFAQDVFVSAPRVFYPRESSSIILDYPNQDIWSVRVDGSNDHAVLNTAANEFVVAASGDYAIYEQGHYTLAQGLERTDYGSLLTGAPLTTLPITERFTRYRFLVGTRAFFNNEHQIVSTNVDGSGLVTHATSPDTVTIDSSDVFGGMLIFREYDPNTGHATLKSAPVSGGGETPLNDGQTYAVYSGHAGNRIVFQSCGVVDDQDGTFSTGPCDVVSIDANGSGLALLASQSANEAVQGIIGSQVIIRRNLSGNDPLVAVPVVGGPERLLMTMTDREFVSLVAGDLIIVRRPSGTWTLDLNGTLRQIGTVQAHSDSIVVGNALCTAGTVWCMPLDGRGQAVKIADTGRIVGVL